MPCCKRSLVGGMKWDTATTICGLHKTASGTKQIMSLMQGCVGNKVYPQFSCIFFLLFIYLMCVCMYVSLLHLQLTPSLAKSPACCTSDWHGVHYRCQQLSVATSTLVTWEKNKVRSLLPDAGASQTKEWTRVMSDTSLKEAIEELLWLSGTWSWWWPFGIYRSRGCKTNCTQQTSVNSDYWGAKNHLQPSWGDTSLSGVCAGADAEMS